MLKFEYLFNEKKKRFDSTETQCNYCRADYVQSEKEAYFLKMYKVLKRWDIIIHSNVQFEKISVGIPRCNSCYKIHRTSLYRAIFYYWLGSATIVAVGTFIWGPMATIVILPILFYAHILIPYFEEKLVAAERISNKLEGAKTNEMVGDLVSKGWVLAEPQP